MQYVKAHVYDEEGNHRGYCVLKDEANKLNSVNLWAESEVTEFQGVLDHLNGSVAISNHWPDITDPEVQGLLNDPQFHPVKMYQANVVDEENSHYVFLKDKDGRDTEDLDETASVIATVSRMVPVNQSDVTVRVRAAREQVARKRAGA